MMRIARAVLLLGAAAVRTDAAMDLQKIQDDYQNQVALSVVAVSCNTPRWCCTARHRRHQSRSPGLIQKISRYSTAIV
jgi:hypothetical protein